MNGNTNVSIFSACGNRLPALGVPVLAAVFIAYLTPRFLDAVAALGHQFFQPDMATDYLKGLLWALCLGASILLWPIGAQDKRLLLLAWSVKVLVALGFMLFYEDFYSLDACGYFLESKKPPVGGLTIADGTANIIRICQLHHDIFPDSYHAMKVSFSMLGLIGVYLFYRGAVIFLRREDGRLLLLFALFPGILFWSSILGKDPIVFFGIALYSFGVIGWRCRRQLLYLVAVLAGIAVATIIRQWLGIIMLAPLALLTLLGLRGVLSRIVAACLILATLALCAGPFMERFHAATVSDLLVVADRTTKGFVGTEGGSTQQIDVDLTSTRGLVTFLPVAAFTALFRPFPGEVMNPFGLLAGMESSILLFLLLRAIKRTRIRELRDPVLLWAISFIATWALVNGIVSSTNFGVGVRYKLQILPLLLGVLLYLARRRDAALPERGTGSG